MDTTLISLAVLQLVVSVRFVILGIRALIGGTEKVGSNNAVVGAVRGVTVTAAAAFLLQYFIHCVLAPLTETQY